MAFNNLSERSWARILAIDRTTCTQYTQKDWKSKEIETENGNRNRKETQKETEYNLKWTTRYELQIWQYNMTEREITEQNRQDKTQKG